MKQTIILCIALLTLSIGTGYAQSTKEQAKEREAMSKMTRAQLNEKATKSARQETKKMKKEGWTTAPGALPIEKQLDRSFEMQYEQNSTGYPLYLMAEAMSIGQNYDGAKMQALELAKQNLAGQIQTEVTALIENTVANEQLEPEEAATVTKSIAASKSLIAQSIGRVIPVVEVYRVLPNKNREVLVRIAYNSDLAKAAAKKAIKKDLEAKGEELHGRIDELLK